MKKQHLAAVDARPQQWAEHLNTYINLVQEQGYAIASIQSQVYLIKRLLVCFAATRKFPSMRSGYSDFGNPCTTHFTRALERQQRSIDFSRCSVSRILFHPRRSRYPSNSG